MEQIGHVGMRKVGVKSRIKTNWLRFWSWGDNTQTSGLQEK